MVTYLFAWNPGKWPWDNLPQALVQIAATGTTSEWWSCKAHRLVRPGDRAFLVRLAAEPKGIMGSGFITTGPFLARHWGDKDKMVSRVDIAFDTLIDPSSGNILSLEQLATPALDKQLWTPQASGISIAPDVAVELERVWYEHTERICGPSRRDSIDTVSQSYFEGARRCVATTHYERNPHARRKCIEHYGPTCTACGIDFGVTYGELGSGFIHVHHLIPVSQSQGPQEVDPVRDLRPICPNCHAMLHRKSPPLSIGALRKVLE